MTIGFFDQRSRTLGRGVVEGVSNRTESIEIVSERHVIMTQLAPWSMPGSYAEAGGALGARRAGR